MHFARVPVRNLCARPVRTALTIFGVSVAAAGFVVMMGLSEGLDRAWASSLEARGTDVLAMRKGAVEILSTSLPDSMAEALKQVPGIADAAGELADMVSLEDGSAAIVFGWASDSYLWRSVRLATGRLPGGDDRDVLVIGQTTATALGIHVGDRLRLLDRVFDVVGVSRSGSALVNTAMVLPLESFQRLLNREGQVTAFHLRLERSTHREHPAAVIEELERRFPTLVFTETQDLADTNFVLGLLRALAWIASTIGLVMGTVIVMNTLLMSVSERTREIGVLTVLGWSPQRVTGMILLEATVVSTVGGVIGAAMGSLAVQWLATATIVRGFIEPQASPLLLLEAAVAAVITGTCAAVYPAWRATGASPAAALRYQ